MNLHDHRGIGKRHFVGGGPDAVVVLDRAEQFVLGNDGLRLCLARIGSGMDSLSGARRAAGRPAAGGPVDLLRPLPEVQPQDRDQQHDADDEERRQFHAGINRP